MAGAAGVNQLEVKIKLPRKPRTCKICALPVLGHHIKVKKISEKSKIICPTQFAELEKDGWGRENAAKSKVSPESFSSLHYFQCVCVLCPAGVVRENPGSQSGKPNPMASHSSTIQGTHHRDQNGTLAVQNARGRFVFV